MSWTPLADRLIHLPLILAGPILRRTEPDAVTVWLALRLPCRVSLFVYATVQGEGYEIAGDPDYRSPLLQATGSTVPLGQSLHLIALTARSIEGQRLTAGQVYLYDLQFHSQASSHPEQTWTLTEALNSDATPRNSISYFDHQLPSFALPPDDINQLKILHGSCRKAHGAGQDAVAIVDGLIERSCTRANDRPHQLFFTGDQIYGDDVADALLLAVTDAGDTLFGWREPLPIDPTEADASTKLFAQDLKLGQRSQIAEHWAGLTAGLNNKTDRSKSHLLSLGEYCSMYLFTWSPVLWSSLPPGREVYPTPRRAKQWDKELQHLQGFLHSLWQVRRALANIPTYMICDDHDISDDWYLNQKWCLQVLGRPLGRRVVQNGLLAYALFQAWGNTPDQFEPGTTGEKLLSAACRWSAAAATDRLIESQLAQYLGLPPLDQQGMPQFRAEGDLLILDRHTDALAWNYVVRSQCHEVLVLDSRTWRGYPADQENYTPPVLLCPSAFDRQLCQPLQQSAASIQATLVIAPTNLFSLQLIDQIQHWNLKQGKTFGNDVGDAWNINRYALARLLRTLFRYRDQVIVLSGDIHYGSTVRVSYWSHEEGAKPEQIQEKSRLLAQLTSSALKNVEWKTMIIHSKLKSLLPERSSYWIGWNHPLKLHRVHPPIRNHDLSSSPNWHFRVDWLKRPSSQVAWMRSSLFSSPVKGWKRLWHWLVQKLWNNRWLQEGNEVIGLSNIGLVQFHQFETDSSRNAGSSSSGKTEKAVSHHLYWYAPWQPYPVVFTSFFVPLDLEETTHEMRE